MDLNFTHCPLDFYIVPEMPLAISEFKRELPNLQLQFFEEISNVIFNRSDLPEINALTRVHKNFKSVSEQDNLWINIGKILKFSNISSKEQTKIFIETTKAQIRDFFFPKKLGLIDICQLRNEMKKELVGLLASTKLADVNRLQDLLKARDALVVWKYLKCKYFHVFDPFKLKHYASADDLVKEAEGFEQWCIDNSFDLAGIQTLQLDMYSFVQVQDMDFPLVLSSLPPQIKYLPNLESLNLSNNRMTSLPLEIKNLPNLESLNLSNNHMTSLPSAIGHCTKFVELNLNNNLLVHLSNEIEKLTELKRLHLGNNQLTNLPTEIGHLTKLQKLDIAQNPFISLPKEIKKFSDLPMFYVGQNKFVPLIYRNTLAVSNIPVIAVLTCVTSVHLIKYPNNDFMVELIYGLISAFGATILAGASQGIAYSALANVVKRFDCSGDLIDDDDSSDILIYTISKK